jgi:hypothetical protein
LRPLQEMLVERAATRAKARAEVFSRQCEPHWRAEVAAPAAKPYEESSALSNFRRALQDGLAC